MQHKGVTRRTLLASATGLAAAAADKGRTSLIEGARYLDPATDFPVERLTNTATASYWPYPYARSISRKGLFFVYASGDGGNTQAFRYELRTGESKQLTDAKNLHAPTLNLIGDDRVLVYMDGLSLMLAPLSNLREREVYRIPDGWELGTGFCVSGDSVNAALVEKKGSRYRLRVVGLAVGNAITLAEGESVLRHPQPRPRRASVLFQQDDELRLVNYDGQNNIRLAATLPSAGAAVWSPDGRRVLYLSRRETSIRLREIVPDTRQDKDLGLTTQYVNFQRNPDGSVLVASSNSIAQPHVLIMLPSVKRELTICEHKASDASMVAPVFSPTSQRVYFQSDRQGKPAIYSVVVNKMIEKTEES